MSGLTWAVAAVVLDGTGRVLLCRQGHGERRWALPGGRLRSPRCPAAAVTEAVLRETGHRVEPVDLVGLYHLSEGPCGCGDGVRPAPAGSPPDVVVHVFRAGSVAAGGTERGAADGCVLGWHHPDALPARLTPVTRAAVTDALAGRAGVLRDLRPDRPATGAPLDEAPITLPGQPGSVSPTPHTLST
ncbi:NUDIX hydrolase [Micromonospora mirobrigensis]|uniref:ADP-ribose pyrophosphatase YjhB, NUDIX family n=1 Tax=Micromonospora mirobrigensis TaxID=262898 RepID=A0A1C5A9J3_9ACTN|nr:NUDIX domain-containing protein [Micromonospora mirobrigensis]SCF41913.1 ADP-ribose pyrophosphatase YjhB, NUDIX family [Micromonospora mirobrigensis]